MRPLLFLTGRSFVNYCRRAVKSPQRLIGLVLIAGYYAWYFGRYLFLGGGPSFGASGTSGFGAPPVQAPFSYRFESAYAVVFWVFTFLAAMLFLSSLTPRGTFRPADIDVLFPTPISPKVVLGFRMVRDGLASLIFPLFFAVALIVRPHGNAIAGMIGHLPLGGALAMRLFAVAYILMAICFVTVGYAIQLWTRRGDAASDRNRKFFNVAVALAFVGVGSFIVAREMGDTSFQTLVELSQVPLLRAVLFIPAAATAIVAAPLQESALSGLGGFAVLGGLIAASIWATLVQIGYLYDQSAQRVAAMPAPRTGRSGDIYSQAADVARRRKGGRTRTGWLFRRWTPTGMAAIVWKDLLLLSRSAVAAYILVILLTLAMVSIGGVSATSTDHLTVVLLAAGAADGLLLGMIGANAGFAELLRRGYLQKPLPFSAVQIVALEVVGKAVPVAVACASIGLVGLLFNVHAWGASIAVAIDGPAFALPVLSVGLLVMLFFPDVDDAAQRSFRSFMTLLGAAAASVVPIGIGALLFVFHTPAVILAIPVAAACLGIAAVIVSLSAGLYAGFNPQD